MLIQLVQRSAITHGHVVNLVHGLGVLRGGGQQVGLHHVGNEAEVAAGFTIAVDIDGLTFDHAGDPLGDDGGIGPIGVLARAEDVEVAQAHALQVVGFAEDVCVQLVHILGYCIRRQRLTDGVFHFGQTGVVAIGAAAGGIDKAFDFGVSRGHQHVQETGDVRGIGGDWVFYATRDAA